MARTSVSTAHASAALALALLVCGAAPVAAQQAPASRALTIYPPTGLPIVPVMEGWYENDDGSVTISFGYHNKNQTGTLVIPFGENNRLEPASYDGVQPTFFDQGRHTGVFTVTLPENARRESVWWHIKAGENEAYKVPARGTSEAYQLDRRPRPQGSVEPLVWFVEGGERSSGPGGIVTTLGRSVRTGLPVMLSVHATDPSRRDPNDPRFQEPVALWVNLAVHHGPAPVELKYNQVAEHIGNRVEIKRIGGKAVKFNLNAPSCQIGRIVSTVHAAPQSQSQLIGAVGPEENNLTLDKFQLFVVFAHFT